MILRSCTSSLCIFPSILLLSLLLQQSSSIHAATSQEWSSRAIYQIVTDRFNTGTNDTSPCADLHTYCGGTFQGIIDQLDYIENLGFDAIWISPVVTNQPDEYHGYAASNLYEINPHFGGEQGLLDLSQALHARGMFLMVDVVANHMGIPPVLNNYTGVVPFDQEEYYHSCGGCPQDNPDELCFIEDWKNRTQIELCQLDGLPDLNQTNPVVRETLLEWIQDLIANYSIDGLRIDTVPEVSLDFWSEFQSTAGVYAVGEVFNANVSEVSSFQGTQGLNATLSYPLYFLLQNLFAQGGNFGQLTMLLQLYSFAFEDINLLGTFLENHDNPRFLSTQSSVQLYKSALLFTMYTPGIPITYYGSEALFRGGGDPLNRRPLWTTGFDQQTPMYEWMQAIMLFRAQTQIWNFPAQEIVSDASIYAFSRGLTFIAVTNSLVAQQQRAISPDLSPFSPGDTICNLFYPTEDCIVVDDDGSWTLYLNSGEQKIYAPEDSITEARKMIDEKRKKHKHKHHHEHEHKHAQPHDTPTIATQ